ncbi:MAG: Rha family transcriptional regulator [Synergistaceae bacterium]|jgi:Rha family phage regulatory protein|nr:Rha family transcriptional regulator [Synergistaceae bacterium]
MNEDFSLINANDSIENRLLDASDLCDAALGVTVKEKRIVVSSKDVARVFEKNHFHVIRDIKELDCSEAFHKSNFGFMMETVAIGKSATRESPYYHMTKNGFVFLIMGYTGKLAAQFKEAYISEFDRMESALRGGPAGGAIAAPSVVAPVQLREHGGENKKKIRYFKRLMKEGRAFVEVSVSQKQKPPTVISGGQQNKESR